VWYFFGIGVSFETPYFFKNEFIFELPPSCIFFSSLGFHSSMFTLRT